MEYGHYEITIKETGREKPVSTEYHGFINHEGLVSFFGLKESDVEWYDIREITGQQEEKPEGSRRDETRIGRFPPGPQERRKRQEYDPLHRRAQAGHTGDGVHHGADGQCPEVPAGRRDTVHI